MFTNRSLRSPTLPASPCPRRTSPSPSPRWAAPRRRKVDQELLFLASSSSSFPKREGDTFTSERSSSQIPPLGKNPISKFEERVVCIILSQRPKTRARPGVIVVFEANKRTKREKRGSYRFARFLQRVKLVRGFYVFHHVSCLVF